MNREVHVRFFEGLRVQLPWATHLWTALHSWYENQTYPDFLRIFSRVSLRIRRRISFVHFMQLPGRSAPNTISGYSAGGIPSCLLPMRYPWPRWCKASESVEDKGFKAASMHWSMSQRGTKGKCFTAVPKRTEKSTPTKTGWRFGTLTMVR